MVMATFAMAKGMGGGAYSEASGAVVPVWTLAMSASLVLIDLWRRKELVLLHNLGVTTHAAVIVASVPALVLEAGLLMILT